MDIHRESGKLIFANYEKTSCINVVGYQIMPKSDLIFIAFVV